MDSGSVFEMDVETIRVVIVSMYLKMIRTSMFGSIWNTAQRENSTCNDCRPHAGMGPRKR
ncbi:hypothetical protein C6P98_15535 [Burkholderia multivorans]|uniref:Uncharacterized protein n=1 Tax=Burkholderia multivorans TaxID=87883 RepID=A0A8E2RVJ1_9BURK|nr:hypothetical protein C6P98_15535 [Burkholderia multivorans]